MVFQESDPGATPVFKGALFDMDGLLLDTERLIIRAFNETVAGYGLPDMSPVILRCIGLRRDATRVILHDALDALVPMRRFDADWKARHSDALAMGIPLKPGALVLLEHLKAAGLPCAVATSTQTAEAVATLETAGLTGYFRDIVGGDRVELGKPAPDIYHAAAASIGQPAQDCAAFEDSNAGTLAAWRSGATTVQVPDIHPPDKKSRALGHTVAPTLLDGARLIGLID